MPRNYSIEFSKRSSLRSNTIGMRATYGLTLLKIKEDLRDLSVFTADTSTSAGLERFRNNYEDNVGYVKDILKKIELLILNNSK